MSKTIFLFIAVVVFTFSHSTLSMERSGRELFPSLTLKKFIKSVSKNTFKTGKLVMKVLRGLNNFKECFGGS